MELFDNQGKLVVVDLKKVDHIERDSKSRKTLFYVDQKIYHAPETTNELAEVYQQYGFQQIYKNKLINLDRVDRREKGYLYIGQKKYAVSRRNEAVLKKILSTV